MPVDATPTSSSTSGGAPCLNCGYDLRHNMRPGAGSIKCTECGAENDLRLLAHQGWTIRNCIMIASVVIGPPAVLLITGWLFLLWTQQLVHLMLTFLLAPAVVSVHAYVAWQAAGGFVVLSKERARRTKWIVLSAAVLLDFSALLTAMRWGWG